MSPSEQQIFFDTQPRRAAKNATEILWSDAVEQPLRLQGRQLEQSSRLTRARGRVPPPIAEPRSIATRGPGNSLTRNASSVLDALASLADVRVADDAPLKNASLSEYTEKPTTTTTRKPSTTRKPETSTIQWQQFYHDATTVAAVPPQSQSTQQNRQLFNFNNVGHILQGVRKFGDIFGGAAGGTTTPTTTSTTPATIATTTKPIADRIAETAVQVIGPNLLPDEVVPFVHNFFPRPSELKDFVSTSPVRLQAGRLKVDLPTRQGNQDASRPCRTPDSGEGLCVEVQDCPYLLANFRQIRRSICFRRLFLPGVCCPSKPPDR